MIGYVEPHGRVRDGGADGRTRAATDATRPATAASCGTSSISTRRSSAGPAILLVDELAHSNLVGGEPAPRHPKRWQDIEELLDAGIDVWTTVNVQHLESLNDLVAQITGVRQRETLPDRIFDEADEVELIDLPPDDLLARLHAGKVYVPEEVGTAIERFFRKPNLIALRELALRRMTDRVEAAARVSLAGDRSSREWLAQRSPARRRSARTGRPSSSCAPASAWPTRCGAKWTVVYVETPALLRLSDGRAQPPDRPAAARGIARRRDGDARRPDGRGGTRRIRAHAHARRV